MKNLPEIIELSKWAILGVIIGILILSVIWFIFFVPIGESDTTDCQASIDCFTGYLDEGFSSMLTYKHREIAKETYGYAKWSQGIEEIGYTDYDLGGNVVTKYVCTCDTNIHPCYHYPNKLKSAGSMSEVISALDSNTWNCTKIY